ncbi:YncE family protein [Shinella sp.]|uniref:YncE family protein n=1 Tax=Shinella sp. TaxID=1870904 RepID=UPI0029A2B1D3|nr:beta-propeller fold lactonase family protein [Shinella sp.]MDX3973312.1 beta-propeller fold lactonase family protein [Shinella sp.]
MSRTPHLGGLDSIATAGQGGGGTAWEISRLLNSVSVSSQESSPSAIVLSPDGTHLFIAGAVSDTVYAYTLSTPWDLSTASYSGQSLSISSQAGAAVAMAASADGTKLYVLDQNSVTIYQYTLPTPWVLTGASYASKSFAPGSGPRGIALSADGAKLFVLGVSSPATVRRYSLSTAWDISTASADSGNTKNVAAEGVGYGLFVNPTGTRLFSTDNTRRRILQYNLSAALDLTTAAVAGSLGTGDADSPRDMHFKPDGTSLFVMDLTSDTVIQIRI